MSLEGEVRLSDGVLVPVSFVMLYLGARLAWYGHLARGRWRRLVESITVSVMTSVLTFVVELLVTPGNPMLPQIAAAIGVVSGAVAYWLSGRYRREIYGWLFGGMLFVPVLVASWFGVPLLPYFESSWWGLLPALLAFWLGREMGYDAFDKVSVFTTSFTGAGWVTTSVFGLVDALRDQSAESLLGLVLSYLLPVVGKVFALFLAMRDGVAGALFFLVAWSAVFGGVFVLGHRHQRRNLLRGTANAQHPDWLLRPGKRTLLVSLGLLALYAAVFYLVRMRGAPPA